MLTVAVELSSLITQSSRGRSCQNSTSLSRNDTIKVLPWLFNASVNHNHIILANTTVCWLKNINLILVSQNLISRIKLIRILLIF